MLSHVNVLITNVIFALKNIILLCNFNFITENKTMERMNGQS